MGIKTFWKILDGQGIGEEGQLCALEGSALAIDLSGWIVASQQITSNNRKIRKPHLRYVRCTGKARADSPVLLM